MSEDRIRRPVELTSRTANGVIKENRYKWVVDDQPGELKWLNKDLIHVHPDYQRPLIERKVMDLTSRWSWAACGALSVGHDNGVYWVYDGQHRLAAAKRHESIHDMPCVVFPRMGTQDQARAFVKSNTNRKQVTAFAKYNALLISGDGPAHRVKTILDDLGLVYAHHPRRAMETRAIAWALKTCEKDEARCRRTLAVAAALSLDSGSPVPDALLDSLAWIDANVEGGLGDKRLVTRLRELGLAEIVAGAEKGAEYVRGQNGGKFTLKSPGSAAYGRGVLDRANSRMRKPFVVKA